MTFNNESFFEYDADPEFDPEPPGDACDFEIFDSEESDDPVAGALTLAAAEDAMKELIQEAGYAYLEIRHRTKQPDMVLSSITMTPYGWNIQTGDHARWAR